MWFHRVAGVTREAKAVQECRSGCRTGIAIGVLARSSPAALLDEVVEAAGVRQVRYRRLPARLMVVFTLAFWLFMRPGYGLVLSKLADAHAGGPGVRGLAGPLDRVDHHGEGELGSAPFKLDGVGEPLACSSPCACVKPPRPWPCRVPRPWWSRRCSGRGRRCRRVGVCARGGPRAWCAGRQAQGPGVVAGCGVSRGDTPVMV
jgi:Insertion element 4 transposase N-terminal